MNRHPDDCRKLPAEQLFTKEIFENPPLAAPLRETGLLVLLKRVRETCGFVPETAVSYLSRELQIPAAEIERVVRDRGMSRDDEDPQFVIRICMGQVCGRQDMSAILKSILEALDIVCDDMPDPRRVYISPDGRFRVEPTGCVGTCSRSPAITVNDELYTSMTPENVKELVHSLCST